MGLAALKGGVSCRELRKPIKFTDERAGFQARTFP
jgi:hypothetical protein